MFHPDSKPQICHDLTLQIISYQIKDNIRNHGSIGLVWETAFGGKLGSRYFGLFLFCFCLAQGEKVTGAKDLVIKKGTASCVASHSFLSFISCSWQFYMFIQTLSGLKTFLYIFFCVLPILIGNFFSFTFFLSLTDNFLFLLLSFDLWPETFFFFCFWSTFAAYQWMDLLSWEVLLFLLPSVKGKIPILGQGLRPMNWGFGSKGL